MVLEDPYELPLKPDRSRLGAKYRGETYLAIPMDRLASHIADLILLFPIMTLAFSPYRRAIEEAKLLDRVVDVHTATLHGALVVFLVGILWEMFFVGLWGTTPGRAIFGLKIVDTWSGKKPRILQAFLRGLVWWASLFLFFGAPFLGVYSNSKRRPLHDRVSDTEARSVKIKRQAVYPNQAELAAGTLAIVLLVFLSTSILSMRLASYQNEKAQSIAKIDEPTMCKDVYENQNDLAVRPPSGNPSISRIETALTMSLTGLIDRKCLDEEANYALWNKEPKRSIAYLAKGLINFSNNPENAIKYFNQACVSQPDSEACRLARWYQDLSDSQTPGTVASQIDEQKNRKEVVHKLEQVASGALRGANRINLNRISTPDWFRLLLLKEMFQLKAEPKLILSVASTPPENRIAGEKFIEYRARALWQLGEKPIAKEILISSLDAFSQKNKISSSAWLCSRELYESGCNEDSERACSAMITSANPDDQEYSTPGYLIAGARFAECRVRLGKGTTRLITTLQKGAQDEQAAKFFEAIRLLNSSEYDRGLNEIRELADQVENFGRDDLYVIEANIRLLEEIKKQSRTNTKVDKELTLLTARWEESSEARRHDDWGRFLFQTLSERRNFAEAARIGEILCASPSYKNDKSFRLQVASLVSRQGNRRLPASVSNGSAAGSPKGVK